MDYNLKLELMMHKYNIDLHHPWFYESVTARSLISKLWKNFKGGGRKLLILADKKGDFENFRIHIPETIEYVLYIYENNTLFALDKCIEDIKKLDIDDIYLISYHDHVRVSMELERNNIRVFDLYDYFAENGLELMHEYHQIESKKYFDERGNASEDTIYECDYGMLFYDKRKYRFAETETIRKYYLEKIIFDCYYMRDFVNGEIFIHEYLKKYSDGQYQNFLDELKTMLKDIKQVIAQKRKKDIVLYWVDAMSFGEDDEMTYLKSVNPRCMVYKNLFTTIDTTGGVASSFFCREMPLESGRFKYKKAIGDGYLIEYLQQEGWGFRYYGIDSIFPYRYVGNVVKDKHTSIVSSENYWSMLCEMAQDTKPTFRIVHLMGLHTPFLSADMEMEEYLPLHGFFCKKDLTMEQKVFAQRRCAMGYEDKQMEFYDQMIEAEGKIYFSDHGCHVRSGANLAELYHTVLKVEADKIGVGENRQILSAINLGKLIQYLVSGDRKYYDSMTSDNAIICGLPYYNKVLVQEVYQLIHFNEMIILGYWGIVQEDIAYFLCNCGIELCYEIRGKRAFLMGYNRSKEKRKQLRKLLEPNIISIDSNKEFRYTKVLFDLFERVKEKNSIEEIRIKGMELCEKLMTEIPKEEKIVIRGGGEDTVMFLDCLIEEQRKRIVGIIDIDKNCAACNWNIPIISLEEAEKMQKVTMLIISSKYHVVMAEEAKKSKNITVIDIYEYLKQLDLPEGKTLSDILYGKGLIYHEEDFIPVDWERLDE